MYSMGGNGQHSGARNSSFALATLRKGGYAVLRHSGGAGGTVTTIPILCSAPFLTLAADMLGSPRGTGRAVASSVRIGISGDTLGLGVASSRPVTHNCTDAVVRYNAMADLEAHVGTYVTLEIEIRTAQVYTIGWASG